MKPSIQILLTVVLVAAGLLVYHALVGPPAPCAGDGAFRASQPAKAGNPVPPAREARDASAPFPAFLQGTGDDLWRDRMDERLAALEARAAVEGAAPGAGNPAGPGEGGDADAPASGEAVEGDRSPQARRERLQRFRTMLEAVERQRRIERAAAQIKQFFGTLDLSLTEAQERDVIGVTLDYQNRWRQRSRKPVKTEEEKQQRREEYEALFGEYERALLDVAPAPEVDRMLVAIRQASAPGSRGRGDR
ncbi:MAG: hypothetical protein ACC662_06520 [Planctomycetota bacterium]